MMIEVRMSREKGNSVIHGLWVSHKYHQCRHWCGQLPGATWTITLSIFRESLLSGSAQDVNLYDTLCGKGLNL